MMKHAAMAFVLTLGLFACGASAVEERLIVGEEVKTMISEGPSVVSMNQPVRLAVGESVSLNNSSLSVGFEGVASDSRCPKDVQCVWAGDAAVTMWLEEAGAERVTFELHTTTEPKEVTHGAYVVRLQEVEPYPESTGSIAAEDYLVTVQVSQ